VAPLLAAGTVSGAIDMSFSTNSVLEVFVLDFASSDTTPLVGGSIAVPERFTRLAWGLKPSEALPYTYGVIAGGLADGSVCLWDPAAIMEGGGKNSMLTKMQKHTGVVRGLEFNAFSPNLLASGAADGELCIWDVANPAQPSLYPALKGGAAGAPAVGSAEISYISWNRKVQHILASTHIDGSTVVWDLKKQRPVITLKDPNSQRRCSVLQWNPDVATQLVVASDDDRSPTLQMWDLRNSMSPVKEFVGHMKGVLGMSWCPQDHSLLLSSSKDNRTICWDVNSTDVICEMPTAEHYNFDVQWCPTVPGIFSTSSFDGKVGIASLLSCTQSEGVGTFNDDFTVTKAAAGDAKPLKKAPTWMMRPCGATFGFGGRLVSFANHKQQITDPATGQVRQVDSATISMTQVVTEQNLVTHSEAFETALAGGDRSTLKEFCAQKAAAAAGAHANDEVETWTFLGVMFEEDARRQLLSKLGFSDVLGGTGVARTQSVGLNAAADHLAAATEQLRVSTDGRPTVEVPPAEDFFNQQEDPQGFFDNLPEQPLQATSSLGASAGQSHHAGHHAADANGSEPPTPMADANSVPESAEREDEIQKALFVGQYDTAVDCCFKAGRLADALLIANIGGPELFKKTMHRYMRRNPRPYMAVLSAMVDGDYMSLVKTRPVAQWRETLAVLATYTHAEQWAQLCDALAARLAQTGMQHAATLCYICAGNVDQAVSYWSKAVRSTAAGGPSMDVLQSVIEKSVVLGMATNSGSASANLADLITTYAGSLATQGRMGIALRYLGMVPGEASTSVAVLKDRIYRSGAQGIPADIAAPPFPFQLEDIRPVQPSTPHGASTTGTSGGYGQYSQQQQQQSGYNRGYGTPTPAYNAPAAAPQQQQYGTTANAYHQQQQTGYGGGTTGYHQQTQQQQQGYGAAAAAPAYGGTGAGAYGAGTYGAAAGGAYGTAAGSAYGAAAGGYDNGHAYGAAGGYQQQMPTQGSGGYGTAAASGYSAAPQPNQAMYAPRPRTATPAAPTPHVPAFTPTVPAAPVASAVPAPMMHQQPAAQQQQHMGTGAQGGQVVAPKAFFTPTTSTTIAQPPSTGRTGGMPAGPPGGAAGGGYGAAGAVGAPPPMVPGMQHAPAAPAAAPAPATPPAPSGPPAHITMQSADVSKVPGDQRAIVNSLNNLFNSCMPLANNPARKREMDDNSKRLGGLFWKLNEGQVSQHVVAKLLQLCAALDQGNWPGASHVQVELTTSDWDECGTWLTALKRLIKLRQMAA